MHGVTGVYAMCYLSMPQKLQDHIRTMNGLKNEKESEEILETGNATLSAT